jgi:hypothetical protein
MKRLSTITDIPKWVEDVFNYYVISELTYISGNRPITVAVTSFFNVDRGSLSLAIPPAFYHKAKCMKKNPKVAVLFSNSKYSGLGSNPAVLVQGDASVGGENFEENGRYVIDMMSKLPDSPRKNDTRKMLKQLKSFMGRSLMGWYMLRIIVDIKPHKIFAWQNGDLEKEPEIYEVK